MLCQIYRSSRQQEMYLYVEKTQGLAKIPADLLQRFGEPEAIMLVHLDGKRQLAQRKRRLGTGTGQATLFDPGEQHLAEPADERAALGERQAVADDQPQDRYEAGQRETLHQHAQYILAANQARIKQGQAGYGHE